MKKLLLLTLLALVSVVSMAQMRTVSGNLIDRDTKDALMQATVQLLKTDSTFVAGAVSDINGKFAVKAPANGKYLVKISSVGYNTVVRRVTLANDKNVALGQIVMGADAVMLKGATVTAQAAKVTVKQDTFVYNASAYRTPEGSVTEELVKKLPGAQVDDDGKITINGKEVKKILVDGKEFMVGDTKTAMKNLPVSIINNIKAYDQKSDLARISGIDDGNEETVLDFGIKPGMNKGMFSNIDLAVGTKNRYANRAMLAYMNSKWRIMGFGNANNTSDRGFPGGGGGGRWGGGQNGLNANKMLGMNINYEDKDKLKADFSVRWNHSDGDVQSNQATQNFVSQIGSFSNSRNINFSRSNNWNLRGRLEWQVDSMTNIMFRPSVSLSSNDGSTRSLSAAYNIDPYSKVIDPLSEEGISLLAGDDDMVNTRSNNSVSYSTNNSLGAMFQINRKLNNKGRNITLQLNGNTSDRESKSLTLSDVTLYQIQNALGTDSVYHTNRYNLTPVKSSNYSVEATYSEPIAKRTYLQFGYTYTYNTNTSDRSTYDFSDIIGNPFAGLTPSYRSWNNYLGRLSGTLADYLDDNLSRYASYKNYIHEFNLQLQLIRDKYQLKAGLMLQPQSTKFVQNYQGLHVDTTRHVTNFTPTLDFRYNPNKVTQLRINYRGSTDQPSMGDLLDITDDSDPLNISKGNPGLKPSFTNRLRLFFNTYLEKKQRAIMTFANYSNTVNSISNMVTYDEKTGGRTTRPENINGNWNANLGFMFNTAIDSAGVWNVNTFTMVNYNNYVGYLSLDRKSNSVKNTTRTTAFTERLQASWRKEWIEITADGSLNYTHTRNLLQSQNNLDTWQFSYGGGLNIYAPWGMTLSTDIHNQSRRGYSDNAMNTNELVWNAQLSQGFLKGKPLTVTLQFYDMLRQMSNYSRSINAMMRSDVEYNSINAYAMLHVIYRLNLFGGKDARQQMEQERGRFNNRPGGGWGRQRGGFGRPGRRFDS